MKHSSMSDYDVDVIPMVEYFNSVGLKTYMSCSGHKDNPYMSMFWIEFDPSVTEQEMMVKTEKTRESMRLRLRTDIYKGFKH